MVNIMKFPMVKAINNILRAKKHPHIYFAHHIEVDTLVMSAGLLHYFCQRLYTAVSLTSKILSDKTCL